MCKPVPGVNKTATSDFYCCKDNKQVDAQQNGTSDSFAANSGMTKMSVLFKSYKGSFVGLVLWSTPASFMSNLDTSWDLIGTETKL